MINIDPGQKRSVTLINRVVTGVPVWTLAPAAVAKLTVNDGAGMTKFIEHNGGVGDATLTITGVEGGKPFVEVLYFAMLRDPTITGTHVGSQIDIS